MTERCMVPLSQCKGQTRNCRPIATPIVPGNGRLSFGTHPLRWLKGAMQISLIGHLLEVPFQALQGHFMTGVAGSFRFQTARRPWPGATA